MENNNKNKKEMESDISEDTSNNDEQHNSEDISDNEDSYNTQDSANVKHNKNKRKVHFVDEINPKRSKMELLKPPTAEELTNLQETQHLYKSHLFRFQMEEMLKSIRIKQKYKTIFETWFDKVKQVVGSLPESKELHLSASGDHLKTDYEGAIRFVRPENCTAVNMHRMFTVQETEIIVDVVISMPKVCFLEKDYLNNRYTVKCKHCLQYIRKKLQKAKLVDSKLAIYPTSQYALLQLTLPSSEKIKVNLHVIPAQNTFKLSRFEPDKSNLRSSLLNSFKDLDSNKIRDNGTPYYNSVLLHELTLAVNYEYVENTVQEYQSVKDAIQLLQLWQQKRGLHLNGFSNNLLNHVVLYLILRQKIYREMSSYHVLRNIWMFLHKTNWHQEPISINKNVSNDKFNMFRKYYDVIFLDKSDSYNLAAFLSLDVYMKVKNEAELALKYLEETDFIFELFKLNICPQVQYDALLRFKDVECANVYSTVEDSVKYKYIGCPQFLIIIQILKILKKGLSNRVLHIVPLEYNDIEGITFPNDITFGLTLNSANAFDNIEKGPPSNHPEGIEFRRFWGELAECRRFMDGSICEIVHFPTNTLHEKRQIFKKIIDFLVTKKLKLNNYQIISDVFEETLILENYVTPFPTGTGEEASLKVISVFDELSKILRGLTLPLSITGIQGASEIFSYTSLFPPVSTNYKWGGKMTSCPEDCIILKQKLGTIPKYVESIDCVIHLANSSKWPNDLNAIHSLKNGFYLEISKLLKEDHQIVSNIKLDCLYVFYEGLVFRFSLYLPKEVSILKKFTTLNGSTAFEETVQSVKIEKSLHILPKTIGALHGLQKQMETFGASTGLIKRWLRSHLIDECHISDIAVTLLNAYLYLRPTAYSRPNLPQVAFLRFLQFMMEFDCNLQYIVVDFNNEITKETLSDLDERFQTSREKFPPLFIITSYDMKDSLFSKSCAKETLKRMSLLAKTTFDYISSSFFKKNEVNNLLMPQSLNSIKELFIPNLEGYNLLIHIKPLMNPRRYQRLNYPNAESSKVQLEKYDKDQSTKMPVVDFNPIEKYLTELRQAYGNVALFFHDPYGGNVIGVLWNPAEQEEKEFKVSHVEGRMLKSNKLHLNTEAIIEDFYLMGENIVREIKLQR
ncbi:hypothetical protein ILUMI_20950 [Ignelater luminosus]|uniref:Nucleolar protein 6 n=1 Tax=Ignelater luminosus TaxID=2038154 RepID=A0A8K0CGJ6_IGNLU|nr:hypothetical protein ILUMI_20950 [Ignelater luminosus]